MQLYTLVGRTHQTTFSIVALSLVLHVALIAAQPLINDESVNPVAMDPTQSLVPAPTPDGPGPLIVGAVDRIPCNTVGASRYINSRCPEEDKVAGPVVFNAGRIDFTAAWVKVSGSLGKRKIIASGEQKNVAGKACVGHRYVIETLCGECMAAFVVISTVPATVEVSNEMSETECPSEAIMFGGKWDPVVDWAGGLIPVAMINLPGSNEVMGIAAVKQHGFNSPSSAPNNITKVEIYNPVTGTFRAKNLAGHDIFCAGFTHLPDGKLLAVGGGQEDNAYRVSTYDSFTSSWSRWGDTLRGHWYGTAVLTKDDNILLALGIDKLDPSNWYPAFDYPEISNGFDFDSPWKNMSGINLEGKGPDRTHFYPWLHLMPNGDILESGPQNNMFTLSSTGVGSITSVGRRNTKRQELESWGGMTIMYDEGKLLSVGGIENWDGDDQPNMLVYKRAITIDMNDPSDIKTELTGELAYERAFANLVVLPSGEVIALGGKNNTNQWDDTLSVFEAESWNPDTGKWTLLAAQSKPRNYHSSAILLKDGRVLSGGGGLCGTCRGVKDLNQPNSQIFSPPYLFDERQQLRKRPLIKKAPLEFRGGRTITVIVAGYLAAEINRFSMVKQSSVTHSISTDARQLRLSIATMSSLSSKVFKYRLRTQRNFNVLTPGYWFLFALNSEGTPSVGREVKVIR